jgi:hypothetical protein
MYDNEDGVMPEKRTRFLKNKVGNAVQIFTDKQDRLFIASPLFLILMIIALCGMFAACGGEPDAPSSVSSIRSASSSSRSSSSRSSVSSAGSVVSVGSSAASSSGPLALGGDITITPAAAQIGGSLTAVYSGNETVSYQWSRDGAALAGKTAATITADAAGNYTVTVSASGYTGKTSAAVAVTGELFYQPLGYTQYTYNAGVKIKTGEASYTSFNYNSKNNYSCLIAQTGYGRSVTSNGITIYENMDKISSILECEYQRLDSFAKYNCYKFTSFNADGTKYYEQILDLEYHYYPNTDILYSGSQNGSIEYFSGANAGQITKSTNDWTYTITILEQSNAISVYKSEVSASYYIIYSYYPDGSYTYEYYNNGLMAGRIVYLNIFIDEKFPFSQYATESFDSNNIRTSYTQTTTEKYGNNLTVITATYNNSGVITGSNEYYYELRVK